MQKNFAVLRTPVLPINYLLHLNEQLASQPGEFEAIIRDRFANDAFLEEAIYVASPQLHVQFRNWLAGKLDEKPKQTHKLAMTLYSYLCRMSSRSTPFGLFATAALIGTAEKTRLQLASRLTFRRQARIDMNCATKIGQELANDPLVKQQLLYYPNSSLYRIDQQYKFIEFTIHDNFQRSYRVSSTEWNPYLERVLHTARKGMVLQDLCAVLVDDDISPEEAMEYLMELEQAQLLVSELEPNVTGTEYADRLLHKLESLEGVSTWLKPLRAIHSDLASQQVNLDKYLQARAQLDQLVDTEKSKHFVQVDLTADTGDSSISHEVVSHLEQSIESLFKIFSPKPLTRLERFKQRFSSRFETRSLPLVHALDSEIGIGYDVFTAELTTSTPLLESIRFSGKGGGTANLTWGKRENALVRKLTETLSQGRQVMTLTRQDVEDLDRFKGKVGTGASVMGTLLTTEQANGRSGDWKFYLKVISGNTGLNLISRFCHGDERLAAAATARAAEETKDTEVIYAEICHLPQARQGNVLLRPRLRDFEIPFLARPCCDAAHQVDLEDLMVSVENNTVVLRSMRLGKRVIPRHTNAYNGEITNLPLFKFLFDLQQQESHYHLTGWTWGFLEEQPFLPRVEFDKFILSPAMWILQKKAVEGIASLPVAEQPAYFNNAFRRLALPRFVHIAEGDNELLIDTANSISLRILVDKLLKDGFVQVTEFLQQPENCVVAGPEGQHTHELVIPLTFPVGKDGDRPGPDPVPVEAPGLQRVFAPGSEWLYIKLYCGCGTADRVIREMLLPLVEELREEQLIDQWFFIRYNDPDDHLRVRFHNGRDPQALQQVWAKVQARTADLLQGGYIHRIQADTYQREVERYGAYTMEACERLFCFDSDAVFQLLRIMDREELPESFRWQAALLGVDSLLSDFGFGLEEKLLLTAEWSRAFFREHGGKKQLLVQLDMSFRQQARLIRQLLSGQGLTAHHMTVEAVLQERSRLTAPEARHILAAVSSEGRHTGELVQSLCHMFLNRVFNTRQRQQELVIYHYLQKGYAAVKAMAKQQVPA